MKCHPELVSGSHEILKQVQYGISLKENKNKAMYIYNVTVSIDKTLAEEWLNWMKTEHIPEILKTGHFTENKICKVLNVDDEGATYSVQYTFETMADIETYQKEHAPRLQAEHTKRYEGMYAAFRTLLEIV